VFNVQTHSKLNEEAPTTPSLQTRESNATPQSAPTKKAKKVTSTVIRKPRHQVATVKPMVFNKKPSTPALTTSQKAKKIHAAVRKLPAYHLEAKTST